MRSVQPQDWSQGTSQESTWSNADKLSRKVRELAHRSYSALKAGTQPYPQNQARSADILHDLLDLRDQVARLQQKIHARRLSAVIPWVDALRQQVEDRLVNALKSGTRCDCEAVKSRE
jgi:hypothetical protein